MNSRISIRGIDGEFLMTIKDALNEYHLVVFDPGGTIGWAHFVVDFKAFSRPEHKILRWLKSWDSGEFLGDEHEQCAQGVKLISDARYRVSHKQMDVVGEDFNLTQLIGGDNLLSPVRINAVFAWESKKLGLEYKLQNRQLRTSVTKERLKLWGFDSKFRKDEFAAMQHGITWLRRLKKESIKRPWKLQDGAWNALHWDCVCSDNIHYECDLIHPED